MCVTDARIFRVHRLSTRSFNPIRLGVRGTAAACTYLSAPVTEWLIHLICHSEMRGHIDSRLSSEPVRRQLETRSFAQQRPLALDDKLRDLGIAIGDQELNKKAPRLFLSA